MSARAFDAVTFDPIQGLIWFAAVVVFGVDSAAGAVLGAALIVAVDTSTRAGVSTLLIGVGAVLLGRLPGGLLYSLRRLLWAGPARAMSPPGPRRLSAAGLALRGRVGR
jgi:branched-chain amino acid transport system permease protein